MRPAPAATDATTGWGSSALRRATLTLAITQLVSWGVLFYGFAVTAPEITEDTGWSDGVVSGAFALGLLIAGFGAPPIARALARYDPRRVLTTGSIVGMIGMLAFAAAPNPPVLYLAWVVIGAAMAATLYEPAMAVLVALDPARRHRTLAVVTVAGGLASTVFAPLAGWLVDAIGWRQALAVLGVGGGVLTAGLHAAVLPSAGAHRTETQVAHVAAPPVDKPLRLMRSAVLFEQAAMIATTAYLISLLVDLVPSVSRIRPGEPPWSDPDGLILPVLTLALAVTPHVGRTMRAAMIEVLESDYVEMARLKGLPERAVLWRHAFPNALGPTLQVIALNIAYLAGGVVIVESLFNFRGVGIALRDAIPEANAPVVQFIAMFIATIYVISNLFADVVTIIVTPRLRTRLS